MSLHKRNVKKITYRIWNLYDIPTKQINFLQAYYSSLVPTVTRILLRSRDIRGQNSLSFLLITYFIFTQWFSLQSHQNLHAFPYFESKMWTAWMWKGLNLKSRYKAIHFETCLYFFKAFLTLWIISSHIAMGCSLVKVNL